MQTSCPPTNPYRLVTVTFKGDIEQLDEHTIQMKVRAIDGPILTTSAIEAIADGLSAQEVDKLIDDVAHFLSVEAIKRSLVIR